MELKGETSKQLGKQLAVIIAKIARFDAPQYWSFPFSPFSSFSPFSPSLLSLLSLTLFEPFFLTSSFAGPNFSLLF